MSILQVGRVFDGIDVDVSSISWSGDQLSISGELALGAITSANRPGTAMACRDRINALISGDEMVVPVVWSEDSSVDGYYRATGVQVSDTMATLIEGHMVWQIDLVRVGRSALPQLELYGLHTVRTNPHSITNASLTAAASPTGPLTAIPTAAFDECSTLGGATASPSRSTRTTSSGALTALDHGGFSFPGSMVTTFTLPAASAYVGACSIRTTYGAATSQLVTGRTAPVAFNGVTISNDLIRASLHPTTTTGLLVEVYDGASWEALGGSSIAWMIELTVSSPANSIDMAPAGIDIIRNSPEVCTIRVVNDDSTGGLFGRVWFDLTVKRGSPIIWGVGQADFNPRFDVQPSSSIASTALTGGMRATSNDANGNRAVWGLGGSVAVTNNTTTGRIQQNSASSPCPFMIGGEIGGSGATGLAAAQSVLYEWYSVRTEAQRAVRR